MRLKTLVLLTFAGSFFASNSHGACQLPSNTPVIQKTMSWCWAANMEFVARYYACTIDQCNFAEELWETLYGTDGKCCPLGGGSGCQSVAPNVSQYKDAMERNRFTVVLAQNGDILNALTATGLRDLICGGTPVVACFGTVTSGMASGHVGTIHSVDDTGPSDEWKFGAMDPARGELGPVYVNLLNGAFPGGTWFKTLPVSWVDCFDVSVGDIQDFDATGNGHDVDLKFKVQELQNSPYAAVYVSDNALGPALLVDSLTAHPAALPDSNLWTDSLRLPPAGNYYYWLDYDTGPFAGKRSPVGLFPADSNPASITGTSAVHFSPPSITSITDVPLDRGGSLTVNWSAPNGYEDADGFNIYRHSYPGGSPGTGSWQVIGWTGTSTLSYVDHGATTGWANDYKVSIAHHGNYVGELQPGDGNVGIWNDFSSVVSASPIDNFGLGAIALLSGDTLRVCPQGDDGSLQAEETIWGNSGGPTVGVPADMLICYMQGDSAQICGSDTLIADGPTDQYGKTTFTTAAIGGHGRAEVIVGVADGFTRLDTVTVYFKSPDENGDGVVDLSDLGAWTVSYPSPPKTYKWYRDFTGDGVIGLGDYTYIASHYDDACSGGGAYASEQRASADAANVALSFSQVRSAETSSFYVDVTVTGQPSFSVMFVSLRSDNPSLEFKNWQPGSFSGRVLVAPVSRNGVNEIAVCALDGGKLAGSSLELGRLTYSIKTAGDVVLSPSDFEVRVADVMTVAGPARIGRSTSSDRDVKRVFLNELAQNYPNPFNPATTIAFSIEKAAHVNLSIYDVRGARVRTLVDQHRNAGAYHADWDGRTDRGQQVASGVYFYKLVAGSFTDTKKMTILK
jgi:FlgD Ig-like domain